MDIGSAKPDSSLRSRIPHHLFDILTPDCQFNAGDFVALADETVEKVLSRGNIPVISGGTAFYVRNYIFGLPESPRGDAEVREELQRELQQRGLPDLYEELERRDPVRAHQIHFRDSYRIVRALEVIRTTGIPFSAGRVSETVRPELMPLILGLQRDRQELYRRIDTRVDDMFRSGLVEEIKFLLQSGYVQEDPGMRGIGYREFFFQGRTGELNRPGVVDLIKRNSRRYAKRQITFFKKIPGVLWFHPDDTDGISSAVNIFLQKWHSVV